MNKIVRLKAMCEKSKIPCMDNTALSGDFVFCLPQGDEFPLDGESNMLIRLCSKVSWKVMKETKQKKRKEAKKGLVSMTTTSTGDEDKEKYNLNNFEIYFEFIKDPRENLAFNIITSSAKLCKFETLRDIFFEFRRHSGHGE